MGIVLFMALTLSTGCGHQRRGGPDAITAPEEIHISSSFHPYPDPNILICKFKAPDYAKKVGENAALFLYSQLLKENFETNISVFTDAEAMAPDQLYIYARENKYDLIITGNVLHYLDGAISTASRVIEEMYIYGIWGGQLQPVGYVKAEESASPLPEADYIFFQRNAKPAPSARRLQQRNAAKFARVLMGMVAGKR